MSKLKLLMGGLIMLIAAIAAVAVFSPKEYGMAPDITFRIIDGRQIHLKGLEGRPVLVTFWATSCPSCLREMPGLISLYDELSGKGFEVVGVAMAYDPPDRVLELAKRRKVTYPVALDIDGSAARAFDDVRFTPAYFLIAPDGKIIKRKIGKMNINKLRKQIFYLLSQQSQTISYK